MKWYLVQLRRGRSVYVSICHRQGTKKEITEYYKNQEIKLLPARACCDCRKQPPYEVSKQPIRCKDCFETFSARLTNTLERLARGKDD